MIAVLLSSCMPVQPHAGLTFIKRLQAARTRRHYGETAQAAQCGPRWAAVSTSCATVSAEHACQCWRCGKVPEVDQGERRVACGDALPICVSCS
jgi:hypothetical protein